MPDVDWAEQIKSRDRVRDLAEVYTHEREVTAMLALVPDMFPSDNDSGNTDRTFLEPACGSGNFLAEVLRRKLRFVTPRRYGRGERLEHRILRCVASIYGIDVSADNVEEARKRMRFVIAEHLAEHGAAGDATPALAEALEAILQTNVIRADTLADAAGIELIEYRPAGSGAFIREWSRPLDPAGGELSLFSLAPRRDELPLHYSALARQTEPLRRDSADREAA